MIRIEKLTVSAGGHELLVEVDAHIHPGDRVGFVGRNGAGKSTLLKTLMGLHLQDSGSVKHRGRYGYLPQAGVEASPETVWAEARKGMTHILELQERLERAVDRLDGSPESIEKHARAEERFQAAGGYQMDEKVGTVLHGLGFGKEDWERPCAEFSGGWRMRIALAKLLLSEPDVLLLDEPTNHLDLHARAWLAGHLAEHKGALVLVSHDRFVLDRCVNTIIELRNQDLDRYSGNFSTFLRLREEADRLRVLTAEKQADEAAKLKRFVERFGAKATKAKQAQSRAKRLEKLNAERVFAPDSEHGPRLRFRSRVARTAEVVDLRGVSGGYDRVLFSNLDLDMRRGQRWMFLGENGCGKSTLLRILGGGMAPLEGRRMLAKGVRVGIFQQDQALALNPEIRPVDAVLEAAPFVTETQARTALGALGLQGEKALQLIGTLSGGQKARVALACLTVRELDVLLLDEPTNHLDVVSVGVLAQAIQDFEGVVVVVTHDRFLIEQCATHVLRFSQAGLDVHEGLRASDLLPPDQIVFESEMDGEGEEEAALSHKERQRLKRESERARKELSKVEARVTALETEIEGVHAQMAEHATDLAKIQELDTRLRALDAELEEKMERWEELGEQLG